MAAAEQIIPMGVLRLNISPTDSSRNDSLGSPQPISLADPYPHVQPAHSATAAPSDPATTCASFYDFSLWFSVTEALGQQLTFATTGSDYDTVVGVFRQEAGGGLTQVACNDQESPGVQTSRASWMSDGGEYLVVVGSYPGFSGGVLRADLSTP
jgi:hypothetical protein